MRVLTLGQVAAIHMAAIGTAELIPSVMRNQTVRHHDRSEIVANREEWRYSVPTICDLLPEVDLQKDASIKFVLSEDNWRQHELCSRALRGQVSQIAGEINEIIHESAGAPGFTRVRVREGLDEPLIDAAVRISDLEKVFGPPTATYDAVGFMERAGTVPNSFAFMNSDSIVIYGVSDLNTVKYVGFCDEFGLLSHFEMSAPVREFLAAQDLTIVDWVIGKVSP